MRRAVRNLLSASTVALALASAPLPVAAASVPGVFRVKRPKITPADAAQKRAEAEVRGNALAATGEAIAAGIEFDNAASELGDPVLYLDAGEAYLKGCETSRNKELAEASIERGKIALDILYFHLDTAADKDFRLVEATEIPALIVRAQKLVEDSEALIAEIEAEEAAAAAAPVETEEAPKTKKPGRGAKIAGAVLIGAGVVGLGVGGAGIALGVRHQQTAESPIVYGEAYDEVAAKGKRANTMAYVGVSLGLVLVGAGIAALVVSKKKKGKSDKYSVVPSFDRRNAGVAVVGRF